MKNYLFHHRMAFCRLRGQLSTLSLLLLLTVCTHTVSGQSWGLTGNAGTDPATNFIGTTDDKDIRFKRNGTKSGLISGNNTAFGVAALQSNTSGENNTVVGVSAGQANTTGIHNSFVGQVAGYSTTTGMQNSFFGSMSGYSNTDGSFNCFFGLSSGFANTSGWGNAFIGASAGVANTTGAMNNFIGYNTGGSNTTGSANNFFGGQSGLYNTTGYYNNFMGQQAGLNNTTGSSNNFIGSFAGLHNTTGDGNSFIGYFAGYNNTTGGYNSIFGYNTGNELNTGAYNTFYGSNTGRGITTGNYNTIIGANVTGLSAGLSNTIILADGQGNQRILVDNNGKVGIGNTAPTEKLDVTGNIYTTGKILINQANNSSVTPYALAVNGSAIFTKAVVKLNANWPDYVFDGSYSLLPLPELETYIRTHKHLPGIPAATDVEKNGIDLGDNQSTLLKKIEELTLYVIELNKRMDILEVENKRLKK